MLNDINKRCLLTLIGFLFIVFNFGKIVIVIVIITLISDLYISNIQRERMRESIKSNNYPRGNYLIIVQSLRFALKSQSANQ